MAKGDLIKEISLSDGTLIRLKQGDRGDNPDLDIVIRYKEVGKRQRTPSHIHWATDLLRKKEHNKELTIKFIHYLLGIWDKVDAFKTSEERLRFEIKYATNDKLKEFEELNRYGEYSVEFIGALIETMMVIEKTGSMKAFMFKKVLEDIENGADTFTIMGTAGFRGRGKS